MTGRIFDIQRFSIHDGPGIRTAVFLKGCPLHCAWCHNPESISPGPLLGYAAEKCVACGACATACPEKAIAYNRDGKAVLNRALCTACGKCAQSCAPQAFQMLGRDATVGEILEVVLRDRAYYDASSGGVTFTGGEPTFQPSFLLALLQASRRARLHTAIETSGFAPWPVFEKLRPLTDLFLWDYKETDPALHSAFTGQPNDLILSNLRRLHDSGALIRLRCPMIPEYNARREHLEGIARTALSLPRLQAVELLPYHRLGRAKLNRFGLPVRFPESVKPPDPATLQGWLAFLENRKVRATAGI
jgi:pyruvate formate lyase activating enzyme